jgi:methylated-DNA-[protein]-cysteine S-methyltransferase
VREILAYCRQPNFRFSVATEPVGTAFQRRVWQAIAAIPAGCTRTYSEIAAELGSSPRAVGGACRANPYPLLVPCHRVVAVNGLGGFAGDTKGRLLAFKRRLLTHEAVLSA